ncbi:uncharacterized protein BJX67DRAFT_297534 [Aspergillus lucknowensis]|uniref:Uncharacterized protein n=1 Tax=Aspergillus lucknowensis TaxID=176173 RepID=A0ABR4LD92_9EURO
MAEKLTADDPPIPASQQVKSSIAFLSDLSLYLKEKPYHLTLTKDREGDSVLTNIVNDIYTNVTFTDITGYEDRFNLDTHGFQLADHKTQLQPHDFGDETLITAVYYKEVEAYLQKLLGADRVRVMQHTVRERPAGFVETQGLAKTNNGRSKPLTGIHIDASPLGAVRRVEKYVPEEVEAIRTRRFQILNVWRPLVPSLRDWPLALCDMRTVAPDDMVEADLISPGFEGENIFLYFSPHYKFYFRDRQSCDQVWIFKQFDSMDGVTKRRSDGRSG